MRRYGRGASMRGMEEAGGKRSPLSQRHNQTYWHSVTAVLTLVAQCNTPFPRRCQQSGNGGKATTVERGWDSRVGRRLPPPEG